MASVRFAAIPLFLLPLRRYLSAAPLILLPVLMGGCGPSPEASEAGGSGDPIPVAGNTHDDLVAFYQVWRTFQEPDFIDGVPDYSPEAMARQHRELGQWQARLAAVDTTGWSVSEQIDWHLIWAEMNGLDFDHRVLRPWARIPGFYTMIHPAQSDVPAHEGPFLAGWIDTWKYEYPLSPEDSGELAERIGRIPAILEQARQNLTGNAHDLWMGGIRAMKSQSADLAALATRTAGAYPQLAQAIRDAGEATDAFVYWLEEERPSKTGPSGIGVEDYNWYLKKVHLLPYTWEEILNIANRELARSHAHLKLEEHRNRDLPPQTRITSAEDYDRALNQAVTDYIAFLKDNEILTLRDYMDQALRERIGSFQPLESPQDLRGFFSEVSYRDPLTMRTHGHHWFDLAMMAKDPHPSPIRAAPLLYNIWDSRAEGVATGMEEWMMNAGLFDDRPRSRELMYILIAQRAARSIAGLMMHANEWNQAEACAFAARWTPRGWMPEDSGTVWGEQDLYLVQPFYGASYLTAKHEIEQLMAERALELGNAYSFKGFMDEMEASGLIPVSTIRWEMTGRNDEILEITRD